MAKLVVSLTVLVLALLALGIMKLVQVSKGPPPQGPAGAPPDTPPVGVPNDPPVGVTSAASAAPARDGRVWGSGLLLTGGIGAFIMAAALALPVLLFAGGANEPSAVVVVLANDLLAGAGWVMIGLGAIGGVRRTNGYAIVVAVFAWLAALFMLAGTVLMGAGGDTGQFFALVGFIAPYVALLFFAIWGFAGVRGFGLGVGLAIGILGVLGSLAGIFAMMMLADSYRHAREDAFRIALYGGIGLSFVALVLGGVGMIGRMRRAPV